MEIGRLGCGEGRVWSEAALPKKAGRFEGSGCSSGLSGQLDRTRSGTEGAATPQHNSAVSTQLEAIAEAFALRRPQLFSSEEAAAKAYDAAARELLGAAAVVNFGDDLEPSCLC